MTTFENTNKEVNEAVFELNKKLGVVISLLLRMIPRDRSSISLREQVRILYGLDMRPRDIAKILGRTQPHINKELVELRNEKKKKYGKKG